MPRVFQKTIKTLMLIEPGLLLLCQLNEAASMLCLGNTGLQVQVRKFDPECLTQECENEFEDEPHNPFLSAQHSDLRVLLDTHPEPWTLTII